jgi:uncharacterized protein YfaA (DUF2138 family)
MKQGINLNELKALDLFESLGSVVIDEFQKEYFRLPLVIERIGEDTFVVHYDNDEDVPEYLAAVRRLFNTLEGKPGRFRAMDITIKQHKTDQP